MSYIYNIRLISFFVYSLQISHGSFDYFLNPCYGVNLDVVSGSCASGDGMAVSQTECI